MSYVEMNGKMVFLIVDPISSNVAAMKVHLTKMGYRNHVTAPDGFHAINYMRTSSVDFVIARMNMPVMSGIELLGELQNDFRIPRKPFLLFDERLDEEDHALIQEFGGDSFLSLPFVTKDLAERVMKTWSKYINPKDAEFYFERARRLLLSCEYQEADKVFSALLKAKRLVARCGIGKAKIAFAQKKADEAIGTALDVVNQTPTFVHGHQFLGEVFLSNSTLASAIQHLCKAIELSPKNPYRYQVVSEILLENQLWAQAITILEQAVARDLLYNFVEEGLAASYLHLNQVERAIVYYQKLVKRNPKATIYLNNIAVCYKKLNQWSAAITSYEAALAIDSKDVRIMYNLALAHVGNGKSEKAIATLQQALLVNPSHEKSKMKLLQLTRPNEFKAQAQRMAKMKLKVDVESEGVGVEQPTERKGGKAADGSGPIISIETLSAIVSDTKRSIDKQNAGKVKALVLTADARSKLENMSTDEVENTYRSALRHVRMQVTALMEVWLDSIVEISEEVAKDTCEVIQSVMGNSEVSVKTLGEFIRAEKKEGHDLYQILKAAVRSDRRLNEILLPMLSDLQFQDYLRQSIHSAKEVARLALNDNDLASIKERSINVFTCPEDKVRYRRTVLQDKTAEDPEFSSGDVMLF